MLFPLAEQIGPFVSIVFQLLIETHHAVPNERLTNFSADGRALPNGGQRVQLLPLRYGGRSLHQKGPKRSQNQVGADW